MSYRSRLYNHRNSQSPEGNDKPFFAKQQEGNNRPGKATFFQAKLNVNNAGDSYEQEADNVAHAVVNNRTAMPVVQHKMISSIQRLSTSKEDEKLSTNDARMEKDKEIQSMPIQRMSSDPEKEKLKGLQKKEDPLKEDEMKKAPVQRKATDPEKEEDIQKKENPLKEEDKLKTGARVQQKQDGNATTTSPQLSSVIEGSAGKGNALPPKTMHEMSASFGVDFSKVKIHDDPEASYMNRELSALAFTHGRDIYFNAGKFDPENSTGKFLLAHELTHVIQQGAADGVYKKEADIIQARTDDPDTGGNSGASGVAAPAGAGTTACGKPAHCPDSFCSPFPSKFLAEQTRNVIGLGLLAGIGGAVSPRVVPLWSQYLFGGAAPQDLSSAFGADFTTSTTTADATVHLVTAIKAQLTSSPPVFPGGGNVVVLDLATLIPAAIADLDTTGSGSEMNFNNIKEIPGNIAGGIGKTQVSCSIGAKPSPFDDSRSASGTVTVIKNADGSLTVLPFITFSVKDTIDLCPGDCGALVEMSATIPMSMMEASGISGDVPFNVDFVAPPAETLPFTIPAPAPAPKPPAPAPRLPSKARVRAKPHLNIRESSNTSSAIIGKYHDGKEITVACVQNGEDVFGNKKWGKTDEGFIADFYLDHLDSNSPPDC